LARVDARRYRGRRARTIALAVFIEPFYVRGTDSACIEVDRTRESVWLFTVVAKADVDHAHHPVAAARSVVEVNSAKTYI
jgi:hypothetical protein